MRPSRSTLRVISRAAARGAAGVLAVAIWPASAGVVILQAPTQTTIQQNTQIQTYGAGNIQQFTYGVQPYGYPVYPNGYYADGGYPGATRPAPLANGGIASPRSPQAYPGRHSRYPGSRDDVGAAGGYRSQEPGRAGRDRPSSYPAGTDHSHFPKRYNQDHSRYPRTGVNPAGNAPINGDLNQDLNRSNPYSGQWVRDRLLTPPEANPRP